VAFYGIPPAKSPVTTATTSSLAVPVATNARSGPVTVATPGGTAVSATDFFVPVLGYTGVQVVATGRISVGGPSVDMALAPIWRQGLLVFDGLAGQRLDLGTIMISGYGTPSATVYRPDGLVLPTTGSSSQVGLASYLSLLPMSGVYTIALVNGSTTHTLRLTLSEEVAVSANVGGDAVNASVTRTAQRARINFQGNAGQRISAGLTWSFPSATLSILGPDGTVLAGPVSLWGSAGAIHSPALPSAGTYAVTVEPASGATGTLTATLSEDVTGTIAIDGPSVPVVISRPGQRARLTFDGIAGQRLGLALTGASMGGTATLYRPDGTQHGSVNFSSSSGAGMNFPPLTSTGSHAVAVDASGVATGNVTLTLSQPVTVQTTLNGSPVTVTATRPAQAALLLFSGTANQRASHVLSGTTVNGQVSVLRPDGNSIQFGYLPSTTFLDRATLPTTGTYSILITPTGATTGGSTVTSYDVPPDVSGSLTINGAAVPVTISAPGQNAVLSFSGTSGQGITIVGTGNTLGGSTLVTLTRPGNTSTAWSVSSSSFNLTTSLTSTGTHTLTIDPQGPSTGSVTVGVTNP
jgi:hypothetical protein